MKSQDKKIRALLYLVVMLSLSILFSKAIERGVLFEISYAAAIRDSTLKKYTISNAVNLVSVCKGKVIIWLHSF